jgi:hypothetical protein
VLLQPVGQGRRDIACALQNSDPRPGGHIPQLLAAQRKRTPDRTIDAQLVRGEIQLRGREMTAYVEQLRRSEKRVKLIEGVSRLVGSFCRMIRPIEEG